MGSRHARAGAGGALSCLLVEVANIAKAAWPLHNMIVADDFVEFLMLPADDLLDRARQASPLLHSASSACEHTTCGYPID